VSRHAHRLSEVCEPEGKIDERKSVLEESAAACFRAPKAPAGAACRELVLPGSNTDQPSELAALDESIELLDIAAEAVVVSHHYLAPSLLGGRENPFDAARCK
jgi:hypothetical protein